MSKPKSTAKAAGSTVSFRLSAGRITLIDAAAAAAHMTRSKYLLWRLKGLEPPAYPALAALAQLMAIRAAVLNSPSVTSAVIGELDRLILSIGHASQDEVTR